MRRIKHLIINIIVNSIILYVIANFIPELGLQITSEYKDIFIVFGVLGVLFWFINSLLKKILKIITLPAKYLTLGISSFIINILMFYVFEQVVNYLDVGIYVQLGTIVQTAILSIIITGLYFLIKKII